MEHAQYTMISTLTAIRQASRFFIHSIYACHIRVTHIRNTSLQNSDKHLIDFIMNFVHRNNKYNLTSVCPLVPEVWGSHKSIAGNSIGSSGYNNGSEYWCVDIMYFLFLSKNAFYAVSEFVTKFAKGRDQQWIIKYW